MKICKYCNTENKDSAKICTSCGSNEFKYKCANCGTVFDEGNFCPKCGVKAGTEARKCPNCGTEYFSPACPNCGYTANSGNSSAAVNAYAPAQPAPRRRTWLWVLGWIFIFPVPLTILMLRNRELKPAIRYLIIAAAWIVYLVIAFSGSNDKTDVTGDIEKTVGMALQRIG